MGLFNKAKEKWNDTKNKWNDRNQAKTDKVGYYYGFGSGNLLYYF